MRILGLIIALGAVAFVATTWFARRGPDAVGLLAPRQPIRITGPGNTLEAVAHALNDDGRLAYDPVTRTAVARASLVIEGELTIGGAGDTTSREILAMATEVCGDLRIDVRPGGTLNMIQQSELRTLSETIDPGACTRGYALFVDGTLNVVDSHIKYISGSQSECVRGGGAAVIRGATFRYCDGSALSLVGVDGQRVTIEGCTLQSEGNWGLFVRDSGGAPVELRDCIIEGRRASVFVTGKDARVRLTDCVLGRGGIVFNGLSGAVDIVWTRRVRVVDTNGVPAPAGVRVRARPAAGAEAIEAITDDTGIAVLCLPDWTARPNASVRRAGTNTAGPYELSLATGDRPFHDTGTRLTATRKDTTPVDVTLP